MDYTKMTTYELERERDRLLCQMMVSNNEAEIELISMEIEEIMDIIDSRDPLSDE